MKDQNTPFLLIASLIIGLFAGYFGSYIQNPPPHASDWSLWVREHVLGFENIRKNETGQIERIVNVEVESSVIETVEQSSPSVVSIIVTKEVPKGQQFSDPFFEDFFGFRIPDTGEGGTEFRQIGGGSGFIVSSDGLIATNKHVVFDEKATYSVLLNDGTSHEANVLARDPVNDLAIIKIEGNNLPALKLGDSDSIKIGQMVVAIGNALGEFSNSVSAGIVSGLSRSVTASGVGIGSERLTNVIQTDAAINPGNSGGPLLNLQGEVIGINTAVAGGAENIGFAIPINEVASVIESVKQHGRIVRPWLGVRYTLINKAIAEANKLSVDYGAIVLRGEKETDLAVVPGSPADKAGIEENDIILEIDGEKIDEDHPLHKAIGKHSVGDQMKLKILHKGEEKELTITLEEFKQ